MRMIAGLLAAAGLMPATATAADRAIHSRPLRATVSTQPWHLRIDDARGRLLDELPGTGPALPGALAYASGGAWFHATRVTRERLAGGVFPATVATTPPRAARAAGGRRLPGAGPPPHPACPDPRGARARRERRSRAERRGAARRLARGDQLPRPPHRALPRLRRALERRRPARQRSREL